MLWPPVSCDMRKSKFNSTKRKNLLQCVIWSVFGLFLSKYHVTKYELHTVWTQTDRMNRREGEKKTDQMATNQNPLSIITEVPNKLRYA